jgi:hypothetical protein
MGRASMPESRPLGSSVKAMKRVGRLTLRITPR